MNQYIITEEMVHEILNTLHGEEYKRIHEILSRYRPYNPQAERERVLDEAIKHLKKREYHSPLLDVDFSLAIRVLEELRQKDGE